MKLTQILSEVEFMTYEGMVQIVYEDSDANEIGDLIRALPGVTTVTIASTDEETSKVTLKVKLITQKQGQEAFQALKQNAISKYPPVKDVEIGDNTIEEK
jgi:cell division protein FtsX